MKRAAGMGLTFLLSACAVGPAGYSREIAAVDSGRVVFLATSEPRCGSCHTLADAGATGTIGPNLDTLRPDAPRVIAAVTQGVGIMGAQEHLTDEQIEALAIYVADVAGRLE